MMEKLMLDSLRTWVEQYGLDGFRFDHHGPSHEEQHGQGAGHAQRD
ncbi:MAG: hypothetical protein R2867_34820 [Caldilineaceae bacterium]